MPQPMPRWDPACGALDPLDSVRNDEMSADETNKKQFMNVSADLCQGGPLTITVEGFFYVNSYISK